MRCYCVTKHGEPLELIQKATPEPDGTEVLVRVRAAGLCHTDLHLWEGYYDLGGGKKLMLADRGLKPPMTLGHEIAGEVVSGGNQAADVRPGAKVLIHPWIGCGACAACARGEENICAKPQALGVVRPGGFAEYVLVPHPRYLVDLANLDPSAAAPLACAGVTVFSALKKFRNRIHEGPVVVFGAGGLGLMAIQVLKAMGGIGAIVVARDPAKREAARAAGALTTLDLKDDDLVASIVRATDGGARAVLDLVSAPATTTVALASLARGGHIVACGLIGGEITLPLPSVVLRPFTLEGSYVGTVDELRELVTLAGNGRLVTIPVQNRPLAEVNSAIDDLYHGRVSGRAVLIP
jgi:D-arabinose 1-dehydrogenase-like Zn-dependent alcohol dehydrogenase